MSILMQDIRFALRMLWKHRLATLVSMVALALGIGANTAVFSVAEGFLIHPVPLPHSDRLVAVSNSLPREHIEMSGVAPATYFDWVAAAKSLDEMGAYAWDEINLTGGSAAQKV